MRILYVTNGFPYPLTSGYLRHYFLIKELINFFEQLILFFGSWFCYSFFGNQI